MLVEQEAAGHLKLGSFPGGACLSSTFVALRLLVAPAAPAPPPRPANREAAQLSSV